METHEGHDAHVAQPIQSVIGRGPSLGQQIGTFIEWSILKSRYLLAPLIFALLVVILTITVDFMKVLMGMTEASQLNEHTVQALELLDITMIANLIWLISAGTYYVFIDNHYPGTSGQPRPRCLTHISTGILKEKMAGSLIGVSSVHLLQLFLHMSESHEAVDWHKLGGLIAIHLLFIIGLLAFNRANSADHHINPQEQENTHAK